MELIQRLIDTFGSASMLNVYVASDGTVEVVFTDQASGRSWSEYGANAAEALFHLEQVMKFG